MIIENVISDELLGILIDNFESREDQHKHTMGMEKLEDPWHLKCARFSNYTTPEVSELLTPILDQYIDTSVNVGDTYFNHLIPHFPHADNNNAFDTINVLIPLQLSSPSAKQYFVVFDQVNTQQGGATWLGDVEDHAADVLAIWEANKDYDRPGDFQHNKKRTFPGSDSIVAGCVSEDIDQDVYDTHLKTSSRPRKLFEGLSIDRVYRWSPGDVIFFNSNQLHCSAKMLVKHKLGLSLRFKGSLKDK